MEWCALLVLASGSCSGDDREVTNRPSTTTIATLVEVDATTTTSAPATASAVEGTVEWLLVVETTTGSQSDALLGRARQIAEAMPELQLGRNLLVSPVTCWLPNEVTRAIPNSDYVLVATSDDEAFVRELAEAIQHIGAPVQAERICVD